MNNRLMLEALKNVEEVGHLTPISDPPDIIGVMLNHVAPKHIHMKERISIVSRRFYLKGEDIRRLIILSEKHGSNETPKERRNRLIDHFAGRLEKETL